MPGLDRARVGWLEEPFPPHDHRSYATAPGTAPSVPLAARREPLHALRVPPRSSPTAGTVLQPDLSKAGGVTEMLRIAALASAWKLPVHCTRP